MAGESLEEFARRLGADAERIAARVDAGVEYVFDRAGHRWKSAMEGRVRGPLVLEGGKPAGEDLATRRGTLGSSFYFRREPNKGARSTMLFGNSAPYARIHELGTVGRGGELPDIVPKNAKALTIPLPAAMTPSGVPKLKSAREWPDTFIWGGEDGLRGAFIVREDPDSPGDLQFLYKLADSVAIPPRLGMRAMFQSQIPAIEGDVRAMIEGALGQ